MEKILSRIAIIILAAMLIALNVVVSNQAAASAAPEPGEPPVPEARTRIEYRTVEVPVQAEPVVVTETEYIPVHVPTERKNRYSGLEVSDEDIELLARLVYHEARGECAAGQRMVVEVVLNRVLAGGYFPTTVREVIYQPGQFSPAPLLASTTPTAAQYEAVRAALTETPITDADVLYFAQGAYNDRVFARVGGHVFCKG